MQVPLPEGDYPRPRSPSWVCVARFPQSILYPPSGAVFELGRVRVISTRVNAKYPDSDGIGPQDHMSVSQGGHRPAKRALAMALAAFGMTGAEEDNHHPGVARHFWRPVDPAHRVACECKEDEALVVEPDGYVWTNPVEGPCRGCWLELLTERPCPIHSRRDAVGP